MYLFVNCFALIRANIICFVCKLFNASNFKYSYRMRMFSRSGVTLRNNGKISFGNNLKLDCGAFVSSNGGNLTIGDDVGIGRNNIIVSQHSIAIGNGTIFGPNVFVYDHDHKFNAEIGVSIKEYNCDSVVVGNNCWIGANTVILKGTVLGDNCVVGAGSVIKGKFPDGSKIVQKRMTEIVGGRNESTGCN